RNSPVEDLNEFDKAAHKIAGAMKKEADGRRRLLKIQKALKGDGRLASIAQSYVQASAMGSKRQNAHVAARLNMTIAQVRDAIHWARKKGLLSETRGRGVPGGELTPKAIALLLSLERIRGDRKLKKILDGAR